MQKTLVYNILSNKARFIRSIWRSEIRLRAKRARAKVTPKQTQLIVDFKPQWTVTYDQYKNQYGHAASERGAYERNARDMNGVGMD